MENNAGATRPKSRVLPSDDYRAILKGKFIEIKKRRPHFSIRALSRKVGCSESFIKKLFSGKVHLGFKFAEQFATALDLEKREEEFLFLHVIFHAAESERIRTLVAAIIESRRNNE